MFADSQDMELLIRGRPTSSSLVGCSRSRDQSVHRCRQRRSRTATSVNKENELITPKDVPHCETCLCLPETIKSLSQQTNFCDRYMEHHDFAPNMDDDHGEDDSPRKQPTGQFSTSRRRSGRNTAVDKLLREMDMSSVELEDDKPKSLGGRQSTARQDYMANQSADGDMISNSRHRYVRCRSSGGDDTLYDSAKLQPELAMASNAEGTCSCDHELTTDRQKRPSITENAGISSFDGRISGSKLNKIANDNEFLDLYPDAKDRGITIDQKNSVVLLGAGDFDDYERLCVDNLKEFDCYHVDKPRESKHINMEDPKVLLSEEEKYSLPSEEQHKDDFDLSAKEFSCTEAHVHELKLVRREVTERIFEETRRLQRLQRHLDDYSPRRNLTAMRSISTMTSPRKRNDLTDNAIHNR